METTKNTAPRITVSTHNHDMVVAATNGTHCVTIVEAVAPSEIECCPNQQGWTPTDRLHPFEQSGVGDWTAVGHRQCGTCGQLVGPLAWKLVADGDAGNIAAVEAWVRAEAVEVAERMRL